MTRYRLGYARVSALEQNPALQIDSLRVAGIDEVFTDHTSAVMHRRPALTELLGRARPGDTLVVWRLDRLGRSTAHLLATVTELGERGIGFVSLTEAIDTTTSAGRLLLGNAVLLAAFERDLLRERTATGLNAARNRQGGRPPKWTADKLVAARQMLAEGRSKTAIAATIGVSRPTLYRHLATTQQVVARQDSLTHINIEDQFIRNPQWILSEEDAKSRWLTIGVQIDELGSRIDAFDPAPAEGSSLYVDEANGAYQVAQAVHSCLTVGRDQLAALKMLVVVNRTVHLTAPATLTRGALEALSAGYWILRPTSRAERVARTAQWHAQNRQYRAMAIGEGTSEPPPAAAGDAKSAGTYMSSGPVKYAETVAALPGLFSAWQLCSGFAHALPWAYLSWSELTDEPITGVTNGGRVAIKNSPARALYPTLPSVVLLTKLLDLYKRRSRKRF